VTNEEVVEFIDKLIDKADNTGPEHNAFYVLYDGLQDLRHRFSHPEEYENK
jgi:hypothetical protein